MFGLRATRRKSGKDEAEKPFWISFSDLMTALMVLFLVSMAVAMLAVTPKPKPKVDEKRSRDDMILACLEDLNALTQNSDFAGVRVRGNSIEFGSLVLFGDGMHTFEKQDHEKFIRKFVPKVLGVARSPTCETWLKKVIVEGFASQTGDYLYNLNLSYLRSQRVLCTLLDSRAPDALSVADRKFIQTLFLVGGSSFNTTAGNAAAMRRVELKLEFRDLGAKPEKAPDIPLDPGLRCPNESR
ncbi:OmpA family protein [soil metagenome]